MDLRQLRYLTAILQYASFSAAAVHLNVTQPALTKSIRKLEETVGVRLLHRGPGGVRPTLYGRNLGAYAKVILSTVEEAKQEIDALRGATRGQLRIGAIPAAMNTLIPWATRAFLVDRPALRLSIIEGLNEGLITALTEGTLDLIVAVEPSQRAPEDLEMQLLEEVEMCIVCAQDHPLADQAEVTLEQLNGFDWVVPSRLEPDRRQLDNMFTSTGLPAPNVAAETTSVMMLMSMMQKTGYLSYLTHESVALLDGFRVLPLKSPTWTRRTVAMSRQHGPTRPAVRIFLNALKEAGEQRGPVSGTND